MSAGGLFGRLDWRRRRFDGTDGSLTAADECERFQTAKPAKKTVPAAAGILTTLTWRGLVSGDAFRQPGSGIGTRQPDTGHNQRGQVRARVVVFERETKNHAQ